MLLPLPGTEPVSSGDQFIAWSLHRLGYRGREFSITCDVLVREYPDLPSVQVIAVLRNNSTTGERMAALLQPQLFVLRQTRKLETFYCSSPAYACFPSI